VTEARIAADSTDVVFGAFVGGELTGVVGLAREARAKNRHKATVFGMYVAPGFGRRGVGRALIRHVVAAARREPGLEQLVLTVTQTNDAARGLYESEGFRSFGIEPRAIRVDGRYYDKNHMVRFLDEG
jgi:ribosomal protein S18 acetylase RimI-like enzyme